jgi:hypothetical protein
MAQTFSFFGLNVREEFPARAPKRTGEALCPTQSGVEEKSHSRSLFKHADRSDLCWALIEQKGGRFSNYFGIAAGSAF